MDLIKNLLWYAYFILDKTYTKMSLWNSSHYEQNFRERMGKKHTYHPLRRYPITEDWYCGQPHGSMSKVVSSGFLVSFLDSNLILVLPLLGKREAWQTSMVTKSFIFSQLRTVSQILWLIGCNRVRPLYQLITLK